MTEKPVSGSEMEILVNENGAEMDSTMQGQVENGINDEGEEENEEQEDIEEEEEEEINGESLWLLGGSVDEYRMAVSNRDTAQASQSLKDMLVVFSSMVSVVYINMATIDVIVYIRRYQLMNLFQLFVDL
jgi:hypothetical protein